MSEGNFDASSISPHKKTPDQTQKTYTTIQFGEYKPHTPQIYRFPNAVTRDNFASVLATSFRVSESDANRHALYMELLKAHTGFDYVTTIQNFRDNRGWDTFSPGEQELFMKQFKSIKAHATNNDGELWEDFHRDPRHELDVQLETFDEQVGYSEWSQELVAKFEARYGSLTKLNQQQFLDYLNEMYPLKRV